MKTLISQLDDKASILQVFKSLEEKPQPNFPEWFSTLRKEALSSFSALSFPKLRDEEWKYTNIEPILENSYSFNTEISVKGLTPKDFETIGEKETGGTQLVFIDGLYSKEFSKVSNADGIFIESFQEALQKHSDQLKPYLGKQADSKTDAFTALNTSFIYDGAFIFVPKGKTVEKTIELVFVSSGNKISQPRNLFVLQENATASVIESHVSLGNEVHFTNSVTETFLNPGANLSHYKMQRQNKQSFHVASNHVSGEKKSRYHS